MMSDPDSLGSVRVLRVDRDYLPLPRLLDGAGEARAVVWPGIGARHRSMHYLALEPGARTVPQDHGETEAVYYVAQGEGVVEDLTGSARYPVRTGAFILITPPSRYRITASPGGPLVCIGGPCPPDPALYSTAAPGRRASREPGA